MNATISEETSRKGPRETRESDLDDLFRELDEEPEGAVAERQRGFQDATGTFAPDRAERSSRLMRGRVARRAGAVLMAIGIVLIAGAFLTLGVSLSLFLFLNIASLLLIALGVLFLPEGSARR